MSDPRSGIMVFDLGGERFALLASCVVEVLRAASTRPFPKAPAIIEGVLDLRGRTVPVLDIRARLGLPAKPLEPSDHLIVARRGERIVALRVDRAVELLAVPEGGIEDAAELTAGGGSIAGVVRTPDGLVLIENLDRFLTEAEERLLAEAEASAAA